MIFRHARAVLSVLCSWYLTAPYVLSAQPIFNPPIIVEPAPTLNAGTTPPTPPIPAPPIEALHALWNWTWLPINPVDPLAPAPQTAPVHIQDLYDQTIVDATQTPPLTRLRLVSRTRWGIYPGPVTGALALTSLQRKGDAVLHVEGGDLILANRTGGKAVRVTTTPPPPAPQVDAERVTITDVGFVGVNRSSPDDRLHVFGETDPAVRVSTGSGALVQLGIATGNGSFSDFAAINDVVLRAGVYDQNQGSDLILTARNPGGAIRFGTG